MNSTGSKSATVPRRNDSSGYDEISVCGVPTIALTWQTGRVCRPVGEFSGGSWEAQRAGYPRPVSDGEPFSAFSDDKQPAAAHAIDLPPLVAPRLTSFSCCAFWDLSSSQLEPHCLAHSGAQPCLCRCLSAYPVGLSHRLLWLSQFMFDLQYSHSGKFSHEWACSMRWDPGNASSAL